MRRWWLRGIVLLGGVVTACASSEPPATTTVVKLVQNPWDASRLDVAIADVLLTEQLGMTVEVTEIDEYTQWQYFVSGAEDACLEVWPSGHAADTAKYIDTGEVENGGLLGPVGKISWYVPTYVLTDDPGADTYAFYQNPANAAAFATPASMGKGQLLSGDPTWTSFDQDIIDSLHLDLNIVWAGTEDAELAQLASAYAQRNPILLYLWTPHAALVKYELSPVKLPPWSAACYAGIPAGTVACDYPPDPLFKILWPGLRVANPRAYQFLKSFTLTSEDQITLLNLVDNDGYSLVQAARWWVSQPANEAIWRKWIPPR